MISVRSTKSRGKLGTACINLPSTRALRAANGHIYLLLNGEFDLEGEGVREDNHHYAKSNFISFHFMSLHFIFILFYFI